jgi:hypothetical protein
MVYENLSRKLQALGIRGVVHFNTQQLWEEARV